MSFLLLKVLRWAELQVRGRVHSPHPPQRWNVTRRFHSCAVRCDFEVLALFLIICFYAIFLQPATLLRFRKKWFSCSEQRIQLHHETGSVVFPAAQICCRNEIHHCTWREESCLHNLPVRCALNKSACFC